MYAEYISKITNFHATCAEETLKMQRKFPEMKRIRGHYHCLLTGLRPHWWLQAPDGQIVDPTASQFNPGGEYIPWTEGAPEPTSKCLQCGEYVYDFHNFCNQQCYELFMKSF